MDWNSESKFHSRNSKSTAWYPESKTALDYVSYDSKILTFKKTREWKHALNTIDKDSLQYITLGNAIKKKLLNLITLHVCLSTRKLKFGLTLGKNHSSKQRISSFTFCQVIFWVALSLLASSPIWGELRENSLPVFASPLACLSRVYFSRYPQNGELARRLGSLCRRRNLTPI